MIFISLARPRASAVASALSTTALFGDSVVFAMALMTLQSLCRGGGSKVGDEEVGAPVAALATLLFNSGDDGIDVIGFGQEAFFVFCKRPRNYYLPDQLA